VKKIINFTQRRRDREMKRRGERSGEGKKARISGRRS